MFTIQTLLILALLFVFIVLCVSLYFNYKHAILILSTVDGVEESLDILDEKYKSVSEILEIPLFYDSPQIRQVHEDIARCRDSILGVATLISGGELPEAEVEEEAE